MKQTPDNFFVRPEHRKYCGDKWGHPALADAFHGDFISNWRDRLEDNRPPRWKSADLAFKRWIRLNSPGNQFYNSAKWEEKLAHAKRLEYGKRQKPVPVYHPRELHQQPKPKPMPEMMRNLVESMRGN